ncbi:hypothetical protein SAY86_028976 [Trapa natans]|uniref:F-box domain-containing protein n=1 Tax=Trapa natans TaxID=22666 RepID=A0AAN7M0K7_TRANT|nr:hypothetical protein SAY86_028976 [Trapa natans]
MAANCPEGIVGSLPDCIVTEILARLPMKSILRAKSVCKHWHKLISDEYFALRNAQVSVRNSMVMIDVTGTSLMFLDGLGGMSQLSLDFLETEVFVRDSHNGLLCCSTFAGEGERVDYYVCNPITRQHMQLPYIGVHAGLVNLACDSSGRKFNVALTGHVCGENDEAEGTAGCWVFDSESNTWEKFIYQLHDHYEFSMISQTGAVFVNGAIHWITHASPAILLVLDLSRNFWSEMMLPDEILQGQDSVFYFLECEGCLSVIEISDSWMVTWVLEDYDNDVWYMLDRVSLHWQTLLRMDTSGLEINPVSQTRQDLILSIGECMFVYHRNSRVWKLMYKMDDYGLTDLLSYTEFPFRATLLPCCQIDDQHH